MDPTQRQLMERDDATAVGDQLSPGALLTGAVVLLAGGVALLSIANATVADVGGGMLVLVGLALGAAAVWQAAQRDA